MKFTELPLAGAFLIEFEPKGDDRGSFMRTFCQNEFKSRGLVGTLVQTNEVSTAKRGTLRGLHYQADPHAETKVVRCLRGRTFYAIADLRTSSKTYLKWHGVILDHDVPASLYIPKGFCGGYQTLEDRTELLYYMDEFFDASLARGYRYDDSSIGVRWPEPVTVLSERDRNLPTIGR